MDGVIQVFADATIYMGLSLWYTLHLLFTITSPLIVGGVLLCLVSLLVQWLVRSTLGWRGVVAISFIGTPIHETSHLLPLILTGARIESFKPFAPDPRTVRLGYVTSRLREDSLIQQMRSLLSDIAPVFGGTIALYLLTRFLFPGLNSELAGGQDLPLFTADVAMRPHAYSQFAWELVAYEQALLAQLVQRMNWRSWQTYLYLYGVLSIISGITPSSTDLRNALRSGIIVVLGLTLIAAVILLFGDVRPRIVDLTAQPVSHLVAWFYLALTLGLISFVLALVITIPIWLLLGAL